MIRGTKMTCLLATAALGLAYAGPAYAQATRTWISGVGDDVNPCSRTAPCKTFAGAISKTAAGGEIDCLDPGGFGTVTITKSITFDCSGTFGSILNSGTNGVNINDGGAGTIDVVIRGLSINGAGTGLTGVNFISGHSLLLENDIIFGNKGSSGDLGVRFAPSTAAKLFINNTTINNNGLGTTGGGVIVQPTGAAGTAMVSILNSRIQNNIAAGFKIDTTSNTATAGITATLTDSEISDAQAGITTVTPVGAQGAQVMLTRVVVARNTAGIIANGAGGVIRVSQSTITNNNTGLVTAASGQIKSYGDNLLDGNGSPGAFTAPNLTKN